MKKRVKTLYRNSTKKQDARKRAEDDKFDIPLQSKECRKFMTFHPDWELVDEKVEAGVSGYKVSAKDRDAIVELQEEALRGEFDVLLVFMFDRLGRIESETPFIVEWFAKHGIEMWSVVEGQQKFETHTDKLTNYIRFWQASGESEKTSIRVKAKFSQMVDEGLYTGGYVAYGYKAVRKGTFNHKNREVYDLEIEPYEADIVRHIFELASENFYGGRKICGALAEEGVRNRKGKLFGQATINRMLDNISYTGVLKSGENISKIHDHLQIIDPALFNKVQEMRKKRRRTDEEIKENAAAQSCNEVAIAPRGGKGLVSGIIRCGECGGKLRTKSRRKNYRKPNDDPANPTIALYCCENRWYESKIAGMCSPEGQATYIAKKIDDVVDTMIRDMLKKIRQMQGKDFIIHKYQGEWARMQGRVSHARNEYNKKQKEILSLEGKIVEAAGADGDMGLLLPILQRLKTEAEPLLEEMEKREAEIAALQNNCGEIEQEYQRIVGWANIYEDADFEIKQMIAAHLIESVYVKKGYELTVNFKISMEQFDEGLNFEAISS